MVGASTPNPPGLTPTFNRISHTAFVLQTLSRAAFFGAAVFAFLVLIIFYRLWVLSTSQMPSGFPLGWLFDLAGTAVSPFKDTGGQASAKSTGYIEFPALVALEVFLVSTLVCVVFGYLLSLFVHVEKSPALAEAVVKEARKPRFRPLAAAAASRSGAAWQRASGAGIAALQRQDWAGYREISERRLQSWGTFVAETAKLAWSRYRRGVKHDWEWLQVKSAQAEAAAEPRARAADEWLRQRSVRIRLAVVAFWQAVRRAVTGGIAALSSAKSGIGDGFQRGSGWYWGNFDMASNRFAGAASRLVSGGETPGTADTQTTDTAESDEGEEPLSRREFLRKVMPNR